MTKCLEICALVLPFGFATAALAQEAPAAAAAPAQAPAAVLTIPAGTQTSVRSTDAIEGNTAKLGARYRASIDDPVMVGSQTVVPALMALLPMN